MNTPTILGIVGPTGVGKSAVAERLARAWGGEIVSADSMQVYRGMDIGTAKTPPGERGVPYHCIDLIDPGTAYSAALYQRDAREAVEDMMRRGRLPVFVGGTGLYVRAALDEMEFPRGEITSPAREALERLAREEGSQALHDRLRAVDPPAADLVHPNNVRRVVRALEMAQEGTSYATQAGGFSERRSWRPGTVLIGLFCERDALYSRIDSRVDQMVAAGLLGEVAGLLERGYRDALTATQAIGYKELVPVLEGVADLEPALEAIKRATRRYAKRQMTWFRADERIAWVDVTGLSSAEATSRVRELLESAAPGTRL